MDITIQEKQITFGNAVVFEIELLNGTTSTVTTIYNHKEVDVEEIISSIYVAIEKSGKSRSVTAKIGQIRDGQFTPLFSAKKKVFDNTNFNNNNFYNG